MPREPTPRAATSLYLKVGGWFEAQATGWGVAAIPLVIVLAAAACRYISG